MYPVAFISGIFTSPNAKNCEIDPDNVVIRNGKSKVTIKPDGDIDIESEANVNVVANNVNIDSPQTSMTGNLQVDGSINCNNDVVADGTSLKNHTHKGAKTGTNTTPTDSDTSPPQ